LRHKKYVTAKGGIKMHKRLTIRLVDELATNLENVSKKRGLSVNALISEIAWDFVESWKKKYNEKPPMP
jgi:predicted DNA-binding protein